MTEYFFDNEGVYFEIPFVSVLEEKVGYL